MTEKVALPIEEASTLQAIIQLIESTVRFINTKNIEVMDTARMERVERRIIAINGTIRALIDFVEVMKESKRLSDSFESDQ